MADFLPSRQELLNAMAAIAAPVNKAIKKGQETLTDIADWLWVVIQGDFAEEQSTAQIVTGTVISMIPFVDQICDIRDLCANAKKIKDDLNNPWAWIGLILTLIGLFPVLGSLFKGIFKVLLAPIRRFMMRPGAKLVQLTGTNIYKLAEPSIESGITELNKFLARPAVKKALKDAKITNIYKATAEKLREIKTKLTKQALLEVFDKLIGYLRQTVNFIDKYGSQIIGQKARKMLQDVLDVRQVANQKLGEFLKPVQDFLEKLAARIDKEADHAYKAKTNIKNLTQFRRVSDDEELDAFRQRKPNWVHKKIKGEELPFEPASQDPKTANTPLHPSLGDTQLALKSGYSHPLQGKYNTFAEDMIEAEVFKEGDVLVRVVAPGSLDNSICWMRKSEFDKLKSREEWRDKFAVWASWNSNGEYLEYTVPKGQKLYGWEGPAASQQRGEFYLKGGGIQIVLDPKNLIPSGLSKRKLTGWGYGTDTIIGDFSIVGVPALETRLGDYTLAPRSENKSK
ncbi:MAG TPA: hypothetical protein K8V79_05380 [Acinetobacter lwoffii]|uniref:Uncharacterized protein n=1 Tax=Acinetobacter lwoffii TaxID=28090 RepID=A0A9D2ZYW9_ACILW|nr:hypothetical protein [Acinetobacter sp. 10FS3-1]MDM1781292.1 hypothetical protein [Acinetobacter indicus]QKQ69009.1 hypothetical protein E5Y90_01475 [Acinetobacter sp. 10FS3-1]HJF27663.1 hypothetical protein [Acinetobacter lwoffii]